MPTPSVEHRNRSRAKLECSHLPLKKRLPYRCIRSLSGSLSLAAQDTMAQEAAQDKHAIPVPSGSSMPTADSLHAEGLREDLLVLPYFEPPPLSARETLANKIRARALGLKQVTGRIA